MEPIAIEKVMMTLSILLTTPENYIQLNSRDVNVSSLMRIGGDNAWQNCNVKEMRNLSGTVNAALNFQIKSNKRLENIILDLKAVKTRLSIPNSDGCSKRKVGEFRIQLPQLPIPFSMWCVNNQYGDNWLLIAYRKVSTTLFRTKSAADSEENGIGEFQGEFFIGFKKLRAITDSHLCELLIVETDKKEKLWYDHYQAVAFGANNEVKLLGEHRTNHAYKRIGLLSHAEVVNRKLKLYLTPNTELTIYLRKTSLHDVPPFIDT